MEKGCGCVVRNAVTRGVAGEKPGVTPVGRVSGGARRLVPADLEVTIEVTVSLSRVSIAGRCDAPFSVAA